LGEDFARHPAQLYEAGSYFILFLILYFMYWKTPIKKRQGILFGTFFTLMWSIRFVVEYFKEPQVPGRADWIINTGQILSIPMILVGLVVIFMANRNYQKHSHEKV
jgi:prolipoprotein diacylglyceryltransferase